MAREKLCTFKEKKLKFGRFRRNKVAFFLFFFACIAINLTDIVSVKKHIVSTELKQLFSVFHCWCMKPMVLADTLGKEVHKHSAAQLSSWQRTVIPLFPPLLSFLFDKNKVGGPARVDSHTRVKRRELAHHANSCFKFSNRINGEKYS